MASFSTMPALNYSAPPPAGVREYDPEIKDMAGYIHNYKIDSELAVCFAIPLPSLGQEVGTYWTDGDTIV